MSLLLGLALTGCSAEFNDQKCETEQDCFPGEVCSSDGLCVPGDGDLDAGEDISTDDVGSDVGPDADNDIDEGDTDPPQQITSVKLSPSTAEVAPGLTIQLTATALDKDGNPMADEAFTWTSSDPSIATVDADGVVTGVALGEVTITVTSQFNTNLSATSTVSVVEASVDRVEISPATADVQEGDTLQFSATAFDESDAEISDATFVWSVDPASGATIDADGLLTAGAYDPANETVTVTVSAEGVEATATVTILLTPVDAVTITDASGGTDFSVEEGATLELNATAFDADGDELAGRDATWASDDEGVATVDADGVVTGVAEGTANITVTIGGVSETIEVTVSAPAANQAPVADAGPTPRNEQAGVLVELDGTNSSDVEDDANSEPLTYAWVFTANPNGDTLDNDDTAIASFTPTNSGQYIVELTVTDSDGATDTAEVTLNVAPAVNDAPVADAGVNQTVEVNSSVTLDATASSDAEDAFADLTFTWDITTDPSAGVDSLDDVNAAQPSFTPSVIGEYILEVTVEDTDGATDTASVTITVEAISGNTAPTADAGTDATITFGNSTTLAGSGSDAEDDVADLLFAWTIAGPETDITQLSNASDPAATFTPLASGEYTLTLTVTDQGMLTGTDTVTITVDPATPTNTDPVAEAGPNQTVTVGTLVNLDGTGSTDVEDDADGTPLTYLWASSGDPSGGTDTLDDVNSPTPSFTPTAVGTYGFDLTVTDSQGAISIDFVIITVEPAATDNDPVVNAGPDATITEGGTHTLAATATDVEDDASSTALTTVWTIAGPDTDVTTQLDDPNSLSAVFTPSGAGTFTLTLTVTDSDSNVVTDNVVITVDPVVANTSPTANAGTAETMTLGNTLTLAGTATDPDQDDATLTIDWSIEAGSPDTSVGQFGDASSLTSTFTPTAAGTYTLTLTVMDDQAEDHSDSVVITVDPAAPAADCLIISEYVEGSSNNKALEIYNCGSNDIDLTEYHYCASQNGNDARTNGCSSTLDLQGQLAVNETLVLCSSQADSGITDVCDKQSSAVQFNGDDTVLIFKDEGVSNGTYEHGTDAIIDAFGKFGNTNNSDFAKDKTYDRCDFTPYLGDDPFPLMDLYHELAEDTFTGLGQPPTEDCN